MVAIPATLLSLRGPDRESVSEDSDYVSLENPE